MAALGAATAGAATGAGEAAPPLAGILPGVGALAGVFLVASAAPYRRAISPAASGEAGAAAGVRDFLADPASSPPTLLRLLAGVLASGLRGRGRYGVRFKIQQL